MVGARILQLKKAGVRLEGSGLDTQHPTHTLPMLDTYVFCTPLIIVGRVILTSCSFLLFKS